MIAGNEAGYKASLDNNKGYLEGISIAQFNADNGNELQL
jgi:hypothetical protein